MLTKYLAGFQAPGFNGPPGFNAPPGFNGPPGGGRGFPPGPPGFPGR